MKEWQWVERLTGNIWLSLLVGFILIVGSNIIHAEFISFVLNVLGLFFIVRGIWVAVKSRKKKTS